MEVQSTKKFGRKLTFVVNCSIVLLALAYIYAWIHTDAKAGEDIEVSPVCILPITVYLIGLAILKFNEAKKYRKGDIDGSTVVLTIMTAVCIYLSIISF
jgi:hypothetical protein